MKSSETRDYPEYLVIEPRKIIQFRLSPEGNIIALCDDGTLWIKQDVWIEILPIPQDEIGDKP